MSRRWGGHVEHRGQVILVAAIGIALTLVTLGLVLNAVAIPAAWWSSENVNSVDAVSATGTMVDGYESAMFYTNFDHCLGKAALGQAFADSGSTWREWFARIENLEGSTVNSTVQDTTIGAIVKQHHSRNFTNKQGDDDWWVISDQAGVRRFSMNVIDENLQNPTTVTESSLASTDAFHVRLYNGTAARDVYFYETDSGGIGIAVVDPGAGLVAPPETVSGSNVIVDFTEGTVAGKHVSSFPDIEPPYSIRFDDAHHAKGRYLFVTSSNESNIDDVDSSFYETCGRQAPCTERAIYNATVRFATNSSTVSFATTRTIAPEDPGLRFGGCDLRHRVVFVDEDNATLSTINGLNESTTIHVGPGFDPDGIGPIISDIDRAGGKDIPFVDDSVLKMIDSTKETPVILSEQAQQIPVAVGDIDTDGTPMVFYKRGGDIYKTGHPGPPIPVYTGEKKPSGIGGIGDIDGDGKPAVVFLVEGDKDIYYYEHNGTIQTIPALVNEGQAIGQPADFDGDGKAKIPVVRDGDIWLYGIEGATEMNESFSSAMGEPMATVDIDHDQRREIVFVAQIGGEGRLYYVEVVGSEKGLVRPVPKEGGNKVPADRDEGAR